MSPVLPLWDEGAEDRNPLFGQQKDCAGLRSVDSLHDSLNRRQRGLANALDTLMT